MNQKKKIKVDSAWTNYVASWLYFTDENSGRGKASPIFHMMEIRGHAPRMVLYTVQGTGTSRGTGVGRKWPWGSSRSTMRRRCLVIISFITNTIKSQCWGCWQPKLIMAREVMLEMNNGDYQGDKSGEHTFYRKRHTQYIPKFLTKTYLLHTLNRIKTYLFPYENESCINALIEVRALPGCH